MNDFVEYDDAADYLNDLRNRRSVEPTCMILWQILWQTYVDLNNASYRKHCLTFLDSNHFTEICGLLDLKHEHVKAALLNARPPKPTMRGKRGGRKKQPIVYSHTFNSRSMNNVSNVY